MRFCRSAGFSRARWWLLLALSVTIVSCNETRDGPTEVRPSLDLDCTLSQSDCATIDEAIDWLEWHEDSDCQAAGQAARALATQILAKEDTMLNAWTALFLAAQVSAADSVDVGTVMRALLIDSAGGQAPIIVVAQRRGAAIHIDLDVSNRAFVRGLGDGQFVKTVTDLPSIAYRKSADPDVLDCPGTTKLLHPACRVRGGATWIGVDEVKRLGAAAISVRVHVMWTHRSPEGDSRLTGFSTVRVLEKTDSGWRTKRVVATAVG